MKSPRPCERHHDGTVKTPIATECLERQVTPPKKAHTSHLCNATWPTTMYRRSGSTADMKWRGDSFQEKVNAKVQSNGGSRRDPLRGPYDHSGLEATTNALARESPRKCAAHQTSAPATLERTSASLEGRMPHGRTSASLEGPVPPSGFLF
jgi:hypothetical protein